MDISILKKKNYSDLMISIKQNNTKEALNNLNDKQNLTKVSNDKYNALSLACKLNNEIVACNIFDFYGYKYLFFEEDENKYNAFTWICLNNMKKIFDKMKNQIFNLFEYIELNTIYKNNETLMILICKNMLNEFGLYLIKENIDLNLFHRNDEDKTALDYALENDMIDLSIEIAKKMKLNKVNDDGETFFMKLCKNENKNKICLNLMKIVDKIDFNFNQQDKFGKTALINCLNLKYLKLAKKIALHMENIDQIDKNNLNALMYAIELQSLDVVKVLLKKTKMINHMTDDGDTAFSIACKMNLKNICLEILKNKNVNCEIIDDGKITPLMYACFENQIEVVEKMLKKKCLLKQKNFLNEDCLMISIVSKYENIALMLAEKYDDLNITYNIHKTETPLFMLVINNNLKKLAKYFIESNKCDFKIFESLNTTPLIYCIAKQRFEIAEMLLTSQKDINCGFVDKISNTALIYSALENNERITKLILKNKNCNPKIKNSYGYDFVHYLFVNKAENEIIYSIKLHEKLFRNIYIEMLKQSNELELNELSKFLKKKILKTKIY